MNESILVEVYLPAALLSIDVKLPLYITIQEVLEVLLPMLKNASKGLFIPDQDTCLYHQRGQCFLPFNVCLCEVSIRHGDRIIII